MSQDMLCLNVKAVLSTAGHSVGSWGGVLTLNITSLRCWVHHAAGSWDAKWLLELWWSNSKIFPRKNFMCVCGVVFLFWMLQHVLSWMMTGIISNMQVGVWLQFCSLQWIKSFNLRLFISFVASVVFHTTEDGFGGQAVPDVYISWQRNFWSFRMRNLLLKHLAYILWFIFSCSDDLIWFVTSVSASLFKGHKWPSTFRIFLDKSDIQIQMNSILIIIVQTEY